MSPPISRLRIVKVFLNTSVKSALELQSHVMGIHNIRISKLITRGL